ncbi:MAG: PAS domain S-box protein [Lautropia sp.]
MTSASNAPAEGYPGFFESVPVPAVILDARLSVVAANPALRSRLGYTDSEIVGRRLHSLIDPGADDAAGAGCDRLSLPAGEHRLLRKDGVRIEVFVQSVRYEHGGQTFHSVLFGESLASPTRSLVPVSQSELFRLTVEQSPVPISIQDHQWRFVLVNKAYCDFVGYDESELTGRDPLDFLHHAQARDEILRQRHASKAFDMDRPPRFTSTRHLIHRDGRVLRYRLEVGFSRGTDGKPLCCAVLIDLSRIDQVETDLAEQTRATRMMQNRFESFTRSTDSAVVVFCSSAHSVVFANTVARQIFDLSPDGTPQLRYSDLWQRADPGARKALDEAYDEMLRRGASQADVELQCDAASSRRTFRVHFTRSADDSQEHFLVADDITSWRRHQQRRFNEEVERREVLVREIHHRIKNHLQGAAGLLHRAATRSPAARAVLTEVATQIHSIAEVHGLQVSAERALLAFDVARRIAQHLERNYGRPITIEAVEDVGEADWMLVEHSAVPTALVLNELMTNAIKHSPEGSRVLMSLKAHEHGLDIEVRNPGVVPCLDQTNRRPRSYGGLAMIASLLSNRGSGFGLTQDGADVVASLSLRPPAIGRSAS